MQIILLHPRMTQARSITLAPRHLAMFLAAFIMAVLLVAGMLYYLLLASGMVAKLPFSPDMQAAPATAQASATAQAPAIDPRVRQNLTQMATRVGELQAQLVRLDALGERVQGLAGVRPEEFNFREKPGRGGAEPSAIQMRELGVQEFQQMLDVLARDIEHRADYLNVVESALMRDRVQAKLLPTSQPVAVGYNASSFGWRLDPFNGRSTFHEGIDFAAPTGTPIAAAAGGVVVTSEYHHQFGNMLEVDHGNGIVSRYAHASRLLVRVGDIVRRGQHIADIGATGRATGAHLHFEVLVSGVPQNPSKFLAAGAAQALRTAQNAPVK
jgi:murein DD-endopeptidase MepM/ murein hydrolase activator NlpD